MAGLSDVLLEPVIEFSLHCQLSLSVCSKEKTSLSKDIIFLEDYPYLNAGIFLRPMALQRTSCQKIGVWK